MPKALQEPKASSASLRITNPFQCRSKGSHCKRTDGALTAAPCKSVFQNRQKERVWKSNSTAEKHGKYAESNTQAHLSFWRHYLKLRIRSKNCSRWYRTNVSRISPQVRLNAASRARPVAKIANGTRYTY